MNRPAPGYLLVRLGDYYEGIVMPEAKYDSKTEGTVIEVSDVVRTSDHAELTKWAVETLKPGTRIVWREFAEGKRQSFEGQETAYVRIEDVEGWSE